MTLPVPARARLLRLADVSLKPMPRDKGAARPSLLRPSHPRACQPIRQVRHACGEKHALAKAGAGIHPSAKDVLDAILHILSLDRRHAVARIPKGVGDHPANPAQRLTALDLEHHRHLVVLA